MFLGYCGGFCPSKERYFASVSACCGMEFVVRTQQSYLKDQALLEDLVCEISDASCIYLALCSELFPILFCPICRKIGELHCIDYSIQGYLIFLIVFFIPLLIQ